jgi:hypothetical protein
MSPWTSGHLTKRALTILAAIGAFLATTYVALAIYTPPPPEGWHQIRIGETREEVLRKGVVQPGSYLAIKGMDQAIQRSESPVYGKVGQLLQVQYDRDMRVERILVHTVTERFRLWVRTTTL